MYFYFIDFQLNNFLRALILNSEWCIFADVNVITNLNFKTMKTNLLPQVEEKIITLRDQQVILDSDVAELYGVQTKEINQAVKNTPENFQKGISFNLIIMKLIL